MKYKTFLEIMLALGNDLRLQFKTRTFNKGKIIGYYSYVCGSGLVTKFYYNNETKFYYCNLEDCKKGFNMLLCFIISTPFILLNLFYFYCWRSLQNDRKKEKQELSLFFEQIAKKYGLNKISDLKIYHNNFYLDQKIAVVNGITVNHYKNKIFISNLAKIVRK